MNHIQIAFQYLYLKYIDFIMPDNKNHHYVPQFYLKNFSFENNSAQIGVFNTESTVYRQAVPIRSQASADYYYGKNNEIEKWLSENENRIAKSFKNILETNGNEILQVKELKDLKSFIVLTEKRNPVRIDWLKKYGSDLEPIIKKIAPETDFEKFLPNLSHDASLKISLGNIEEMVRLIEDLDFVLFLNKTSIPYITSDYPVIQYNQFLEKHDYYRGKGGYATLGLQMFLPLSPKLLLLLYDKSTYNVGSKNDRYIDIRNSFEINQINLLQILNCSSLIFFNHETDEEYLRKIHNKSKKYQKAHNQVSEIAGKRIDENGLERYLIHTQEITLDINLRLDQIKIKPKAKRFELGNWIPVLDRPLDKYFEVIK